MIVPLNSSHGPAQPESLALLMTTAMHIHFHTGPLSVIVILWTAVARAFVEPAALMVPPVDAIPLLMTRLLFVSRVIVNVPLDGLPGVESTIPGVSAPNPDASPS